mgnify:CR=1 FL=1
MGSLSQERALLSRGIPTNARVKLMHDYDPLPLPDWIDYSGQERRRRAGDC